MVYWYILILLVFINFGTEKVNCACLTENLPSNNYTKHNASDEEYENGTLISFKCIEGYYDQQASSVIYQCLGINLSRERKRFVWKKPIKVINCTSDAVSGDLKSSDGSTRALETTLSTSILQVIPSLSIIYAEITSIKASIHEKSPSYLKSTNHLEGQLQWSSTVITVQQQPYDSSCNCQVLETVYSNLTTDIVHCSVINSHTKIHITYNHSLLTTWKKHKPPVYEARYSVAIGSTIYLFLGFGLVYILVLDIPRIVEHIKKYHKIFNRKETKVSN